MASVIFALAQSPLVVFFGVIALMVGASVVLVRILHLQEDYS